MRKILLLFVITLFCFSGSASGIDSVYFTADSGVGVEGNTIYMHPLGGGDVKIAINCYNETAMAALVYPLVELCGIADLDEAKNNHSLLIPKSYLGGRVHLVGWSIMSFCQNIYPFSSQFNVGATAMLSPPLMPGDGYIAKVTFTIPSGAEDTCICLDTAFYPPSSVLTHVETTAVGYTPHFTAKCFPVLRRANTPPDINCPSTVTGYAEASVSWMVSATDPDGDDFTITNIFFSADSCGTLGYTGTNPWEITFTTTGCVPGTYNLYVEVTDEFGASDTCVTAVTLESFFAVVTLEEVDCVFPGGVATVPVDIFSGMDIGGFKLYIEYDPTVMTFLGLERGDLIDGFDGYYDDYDHVPRYFFQYFNHRMLPCAQQCETYKIKIVGIADMPDGRITGPLPAGEGNLMNLKFKVANSALLQDLLLPVKFEFDYDFDLKAPSFSSATGESLYVDVDWPGELTGPNYGIFPIVTFVNGGVKVCSDAFCWAGDINMNEYPYEIADAVLFANYFIYGIDVFDIDLALQLLATDVNQDGFYPSIADFVFLIRIILEDISPKHKLAPSTDLVDVTLTTQGDAVKITSNSNSTIGAGLYVFKHSGEVKNLTMNTDMSVKFNDTNGELRVLVYSFQGKTIPAGVIELFSFEAEDVELVEVETVDFYGSILKSTISNKVLPTSFALMNNYPNPFNLSTSISFAIPVDSKVSLKLYNIAGRLVQAFDQEYHAGVHTIVWDGTNTRGETVASGIYLYRLVAGEYTCTRKMVLMK